MFSHNPLLDLSHRTPIPYPFQFRLRILEVHTHTFSSLRTMHESRQFIEPLTVHPHPGDFSLHLTAFHHIGSKRSNIYTHLAYINVPFHYSPNPYLLSSEFQVAVLLHSTLTHITYTIIINIPLLMHNYAQFYHTTNHRCRIQ